MPLSPHRSPSQRLAALTAATLAVAGLSLGGCDKPADVAVRQDLSDAYAYRSGGDPNRKYVQMATKAATDSGGGDFPPATAALAQELVGDVSVESANGVLGGNAMAAGDPNFATGGLLQVESAALSLAGEAARLADAIALGTTYIAGQQASDPQPTLALITQKISLVQGNEAWQPAPDVQASVAGLGQTQAKIEDLNGQITQLQGRIDALDKQRSDKLSQASTLDEQSQQQGGRQGVTTFRQVSDLRNEATALLAQQTKLGGELMAAKMSLAEQQALKTALDDAVAALQKQQQTLQTAWQGVQGQIGQLRQANETTYGGGGAANPAGGPNVEALSGQLADVIKRMEEQKRDALRLLGDAATAYTKSGERAGKVVQSVAGEPDKALGKAIRDAFDTKRINLKQAVARRQVGRVEAASANVYAALIRLQDTLKAGGRDLPASLGVDPRKEYAAAVSAAAEAFDNAGTQMSNVTDSATGPLQSAAITQKAVLLSAMLGLSDLVAATGVEASSSLPSRQELETQIGQVISAARNLTPPAILPPTAGFAAGAAAPASDGEATTPPADGTAPAPADANAPEAAPAEEPR